MFSENPKSKKQRTEECIINSLPSDLIEQIFLGLPVSTLLRCIGVCKIWYNFIRDPQFVTAQLQHAPRCALLFFPQESVERKLYPSDAIIFDEAWSQSTRAVPVIGPDDFLCGSCNGLLCLYTKTSTIKIANFATGECLHLDKPIKNLKGDHFSFYSFGFHPVTKEYKVTHFIGEDQNYSRGTFNAIQVYTLGSENWKDVATPEALNLFSMRNSGVVNVDGAMCWLTEDIGASWKHSVISFDLSKETFTRIQLPAVALGGSGCRRYWITEIDRKVCVATAQVYRHLPRMLAGELRIWTLDNKVEQRWSQKCIIQHAPNYIPGPHFVHRDKIMMHSRDCNLYSYELFGKNYEIKLSSRAKLLDFSPHKPQNMQSYICVKSLVRLDAYKKVGLVRRPKRWEGWELKKWEVWERELRNLEDLCSTIHQLEQDMSELAHLMATKINQVLHWLPDETRHVGMKIIQMLQCAPDGPDQPTSSRRLNWVEHKQVMEKLRIRVDNLRYKIEATTQAKEKIFSVLDSYIPDQGGSSSNAENSPQ
ncbi:F-box protein At3g07870-like [Phragmites australis]|uniref:F-box protein At3g07870-like n=1 Tax=Phragmites australis TaxID=29695 RepID=UPI002D769DFC|nr:F-box protein At3g07870-like [Phragmites australis]